jgi:hypothetical protein
VGTWAVARRILLAFSKMMRMCLCEGEGRGVGRGGEGGCVMVGWGDIGNDE